VTGANGAADAYAQADLPTVTSERLDEAITKLLPTHMQLIMGIGTAEELALAEVKAAEAMKRTVVQGSDDDADPPATVETRCPVTGRVAIRDRTAADPPVWTARRISGWAPYRSSRGHSRATPSRSSRAATTSGASRRASWTRTSRP
jgi:hypothetical protein